MISATIDTNTLVSAIININSSVSQEIYQSFIEKRFLLITSPSILEEVDEVIHRERIMSFHKLPLKQLEEIISELANLSYIVPGNTKIDISRDPDDNKIIAAAVEGNTDYIVSRDRDILDLKEYNNIKIISPEQFMKVLRSHQ